MNRTRKIAAATLATGVLAVGVLVPAAARDSDDTENDTGTDRDAGATRAAGDVADVTRAARDAGATRAARDVADVDDLLDLARDERRVAHHAAFAEALAEELDLDVDTVARALDAARERIRSEHQDERRAALEQRLADAVEQGALSQEQADAIEDAHDAGVRLFPGAPEARGMPHQLDRDELRGLGRDGGRHGWGAGHGRGTHGSPFAGWGPDDDPEPAA